jgi:hypothetical protein
MVWWHDHLYVGTARESVCTALFSLWQYVAAVIGLDFANTYLPYPPPDPDLACAPDGADLPLQAEIWRWTPDNESWGRVFQSPLDLNNPARPGKKLPYDIAIRGLVPYTDPDGTDALYAFGINSAVMWDSTKLPPPRILRSTDGANFLPIPQTPGTFLGDLPFNPDHSSFRSPVSFAGKLFVLSGPIFGQGTLIGSADPAKGDNAWFVASPPGVLFYETQVFNGWLYLGTFSPTGGYAVVKTRAQGPPPYQFVTVVPAGAGLKTHPSGSVVSMHEYNGRLYVGTAAFTEVIRINPDDTWELVVGAPRNIPSPTGVGSGEWKYPLSGLDAGFGTTFNDHAWNMADVNGDLLIGTYNASTGTKNSALYGPLLEPMMGAHLYRTGDGWYYNAITANAFANLNDPHGGKFDYGFRTITPTPHGVFLGTANDYYGLAIFRGRLLENGPPPFPGRLEVDAAKSGRALLSWNPAPNATQYQIWRAERNYIYVRAELNFETWNGVFGNFVQDTFIGPYIKVGETKDTSFFDGTVDPTTGTVNSSKRYMYYVVAETPAGNSNPSNLVGYPLLTPAMTFSGLLQQVGKTEQRKRYTDAVLKLSQVRAQILSARSLALTCHIPEAINTLEAVKGTLAGAVLAPEATDLEIVISKLQRRLMLYNQFPAEVSTFEFCTM